MNDRPNPHPGHAAQPGTRRPPGRARRERCVALADARFVEWLCDRDEGDAIQLARWPGLVDHLLASTVGPTDLVRTYWYTRRIPAHDASSVSLRPVVAESVDAGVSLVLSMARDLTTLARHGACDLVLVVCDDDRLLPAIDAAQLQGLRVMMVTEAAAADLGAFARQDASLAAVLRQADARLAIDGAWLAAMLYGQEGGDAPGIAEPGTGILDFRGREHPAAYANAYADADVARAERPPRPGQRSGPDHSEDDRAVRRRPEPPTLQERAALRERLGPPLQGWWDDLPHEDRQELQEQLPAQRGLPQEIDRQLLLRLSQALGRPLAPVEKVSMRELVRAIALGHDAPSGKSVRDLETAPREIEGSRPDADHETDAVR